eukprot:scaffold37188_cov29-Attheya_sp.AAC.7
MHKSLCENAAAVTSNLGGGNHGHLALLMTDMAYFEETQLAFIAPTKPGDDPPTALNPEEQPFVNDRYKRNQRIYEKYGNTDKVLKKQIETTVEAAFISTLRHELTGFNQVTALQMITHLYATYGDIDEVDIKDNKVAMMKAYDPEKPLTTLISQLEEGRDFAHIGLQPISENVMVTKGITLLSNTAVFNEDIKEWWRKPEAEKTWSLLKTHFQRAHKERRKATTTAGQGGYSATVNSIYGMPTNEEQAAQQDLQERAAKSLETISNGLSTHQDSISELTQANAVLSNSNTTLAAQMAQMMQQMQTLQLLVSQSHGHAPAAAPSAAPPAGGGRQHKCRQPLPYDYCWSHGKSNNTQSPINQENRTNTRWRRLWPSNRAQRQQLTTCFAC